MGSLATIGFILTDPPFLILNNIELYFSTTISMACEKESSLNCKPAYCICAENSKLNIV